MRRALLMTLIACGAPAAAPPICPISPAVAPAPTAPEKPSDGPPSLQVVLRPVPGSRPKLRVALRARAPGERSLRIVVATSAVSALSVKDSKGPIEARAEDDAPSVNISLARAPEGVFEVAYELDANPNARAQASDLVVADDRFRAFGENTVAIPSTLIDAAMDITVAIDGAEIHAPDAASSFGVGAARTRRAKGRALARSAFMAGALGRAAFDAGAEHDEAAWLGYTTFDPRPVAAEIASVRSAMREQWKGGGDDAFALLFVSSARPKGAYAMVSRASSLLVHLGPNEPWSAAMRVGVAQHLMQAWIGGELQLGLLSEGVARFLAARELEQLDLLTPDDAKAFIVGLLSAQATSPHRGEKAAGLSRTDPAARAHFIALGALHAARVSSLFKAKKRAIEPVVLSLLERARQKTLPEDAWRAMIERELGADEAKALDDALSGKEITLDASALGPCFQGRRGEYEAFELGFDPVATSESTARTIVGLDPKGPAARAGLEASDVLEDASFSEGRSDVPVKLVVTRAGAKKEIAYKPSGAKRTGAVFTRVPGKADDACGSVL